MFTLNVDQTQFGLKPMNCPGHCLMFGHTVRSHKDLPIRYADFGVLHRNEMAGALSGLTRVRRFCQDDAHIFCRKDQIKQEMAGALSFLKHVYGTFGFEFILNLSTRPEKFLGEIAVWEDAEKALAEALDDWAGKDKWNLKKGDGAFYGPKIDIQIFDVYKREHQCATIQLDFQLPKRFNLHFVKDDGSAEGDDSQPVIIHRAILGSLERFMAILIESTNGKWPLWLNPHPIMIVPIGPKFYEYGEKVRHQIFASGLDVELDDGEHSFGKKIAEARNMGVNYILVVGEEEEKQASVNVRSRDCSDQVLKSVVEFIGICKEGINEKQ
jgi:threonyl-tRNA synthetase